MTTQNYTVAVYLVGGEWIKSIRRFYTEENAAAYARRMNRLLNRRPAAAVQSNGVYVAQVYEGEPPFVHHA